MVNDFPSRETIERLRKQFPRGARVELIRMEDPLSRIRDNGSYLESYIIKELQAEVTRYAKQQLVIRDNKSPEPAKLFQDFLVRDLKPVSVQVGGKSFVIWYRFFHCLTL